MPRRSKARARVLRRRVVFRGRVFPVRRDTVREPPLPAGKGSAQARVVVREVVEHRGSVVLLPVFPDGRLLLVRQYRHAVGEFLWELVAGHIEPGESPRAAARRLQRLLTFYPSPGFVSEKMILYRASGLRPGRARPRADEALEARAFRRAELERMIRRGPVRDAKSLVGLLLPPERARP